LSRASGESILVTCSYVYQRQPKTMYKIVN
jgi:hypothetical protein